MAGFSIGDFVIEGRFQVHLDDSEHHLVIWLAQEESDDRVAWVLSRVEIARRGGYSSEPLTMGQIRKLPMARIEAIARRQMLEWERQVKAEGKD